MLSLLIVFPCNSPSGVSQSHRRTSYLNGRGTGLCDTPEGGESPERPSAGTTCGVLSPCATTNSTTTLGLRSSTASQGAPVTFNLQPQTPCPQPSILHFEPAPETPTSPRQVSNWEFQTQRFALNMFRGTGETLLRMTTAPTSWTFGVFLGDSQLDT